MGGTKHLALIGALVLLVVGTSMGWGSEKVKLKDVQVLTLKQGDMTTGRRSSPVPQLKCLGGSAGCEFMPRVVQCYNRGSDGYDIQWECKADMDNDYRFGDIRVTCEGYDYPDDPYILKGSCGLEYTIDFTKEGKQRSGSAHQQSYRGSDNSRDYGWDSNILKSTKPKSDFFTNLCCGAVVVIIVYGIYKTCITPTDRTHQRSTTNDDYHGRGPGSGSSPPPPGFRSDYYSGDSGFGGGSDSCSGSRRGTGSSQSTGPSAGGFWTGAATGGLLGYMFGSRNNNTYYNTGGATYRPRPSTSWGDSGSSWFGSSSSSSGGGSSSSGSRSASGFGGTSRR